MPASRVGPTDKTLANFLDTPEVVEALRAAAETDESRAVREEAQKSLGEQH